MDKKQYIEDEKTFSAGRTDMPRFQMLLADCRVRALFDRLEALEKDRIYCKHGLSHCLDVARIGYLLILEERGRVPKELFYVAALLHDLGRVAQYEKGTGHHEAGAVLAGEILKDYPFTDEEKGMLCQAIASHREEGRQEEGSLAAYLYRSDKLSRNCFACPASQSCYWEESQKNKSVLL